MTSGYQTNCSCVRQIDIQLRNLYITWRRLQHVMKDSASVRSLLPNWFWLIFKIHSEKETVIVILFQVILVNVENLRRKTIVVFINSYYFYNYCFLKIGYKEYKLNTHESCLSSKAKYCIACLDICRNGSVNTFLHDHCKYQKIYIT